MIDRVTRPDGLGYYLAALRASLKREPFDTWGASLRIVGLPAFLSNADLKAGG